MGINQSGQGYHVQFFHRFFLLQHTCQHFRVFRLRILIVFKPLRIDPVLTFFSALTTQLCLSICLQPSLMRIVDLF